MDTATSSTTAHPTHPGEATARPLDLDQMRCRLESAIQTEKSAVAQDAGAGSSQWVLERSAQLAAVLLGVDVDRLLAPGRRQPVADARAVAHAASRRCGLTLPRIAGHYGQHHTTVMHSVEKVAESPQLRTATDLIAAHLLGVTAETTAA